MNLDDPETLAKVIAEAIDDKELEQRGEKGDELWCAPNQQTPYTGWRLVRYGNGRTMALGHCRDGELDGPSMGWSSNGRKEEESTWKDGKIMTYVVFKPNGEKCPETNVVNGNGVLVFYDDDGEVATRATCKDGEVVFHSGQAEEEEERDDEENVSLTLPGVLLNCLPPFAFIGGVAYCMEKYWGMDLEDPDSNVPIILFAAFWVIAVGWFYFADFIKKKVALR